ncbi:MAG: hypothetical protein ABIF92_01935, partial [archaeon]
MSKKEFLQNKKKYEEDRKTKVSLLLREIVSKYATNLLDLEKIVAIDIGSGNFDYFDSYVLFLRDYGRYPHKIKVFASDSMSFALNLAEKIDSKLVKKNWLSFVVSHHNDLEKNLKGEKANFISIFNPFRIDEFK